MMIKKVIYPPEMAWLLRRYTAGFIYRLMITLVYRASISMVICDAAPLILLLHLL